MIQSSFRFVVIAGITAALAACSSGSSNHATSSPSRATSASSDAPVTAASSGQTVTATCSQLTKADFQALLSPIVTGVTVMPAGSNTKGQTCKATTADESSAISITVLPANDQQQNYNDDVVSLAQPVSVAGVGDKASRDGGDDTATVTSTKGNLYCSVTPQTDDIPGVAQLEDAAGHKSDIGDKYYAEIVAAVATLCNRVYGSGNTTPDLTGLKAAGAKAASSPPNTGSTLTVPPLPPGLNSSPTT